MRLKLLITVAFVLQHCILSAQNGVRIAAATGTADASAMLDVVSTTKGFLVPRMNLTGPALTNPAPVTSPATGLLVYNLGGGGIAATGFYYWNGTQWVQLSAGALSGAGTVDYLAKWTSPSAIAATTDGGMVGTSGTAGTTRALTILENGDTRISFGSYPGNWTSALQIQNNDNTRFLWLNPLDNASGANARIRASGSGLDIYTGGGNDAGTYSATFASNGNLGVGITAPAQKLHVGAGNNDGIIIGNYNDQLGWNGSGTAPEYSIRFAGYRDVVSNFVGAKISAIRTNICCSGLSQGTELSFLTQEATATAGGDANLVERIRIGNGGTVKVTNLAGSGIRPVFASSNGTLVTTNFPNATVFSYTGANQTYTVPAGVTSVTIKLWGAGGGGGYYGGWTTGFSGGAGGFTQGVLAVTAGQVLTVIVGGGGLGGNTANMSQSYGGGARSCNTGSDCRYGGQGGGRSAIRNAGGTELLTAGGGGGGGSSRNGSLTNYGGAGGGIEGQAGTSDQYNYAAGTGGNQNAGGAGGCCVTSVGAAGSQFAGGNPSNNAYGGGGGGGWYGGGGGGYNESNTMGGGGGGSGYISGAGVTNAFTMTGFRSEPPKVDDPHYVQGIGRGGLTYGTSVPLQGGHGRVVIIPNP